MVSGAVSSGGRATRHRPVTARPIREAARAGDRAKPAKGYATAAAIRLSRASSRCRHCGFSSAGASAHASAPDQQVRRWSVCAVRQTGGKGFLIRLCVALPGSPKPPPGTQRRELSAQHAPGTPDDEPTPCQAQGTPDIESKQYGGQQTDSARILPHIIACAAQNGPCGIHPTERDLYRPHLGDQHLALRGNTLQQTAALQAEIIQLRHLRLSDGADLPATRQCWPRTVVPAAAWPC